MARHLFIAAALLVALVVLWPEPAIVHGPGMVAPHPPVQGPGFLGTPIRYGEYFLEPRAEFELEARVLSREDYWFGRESDLAPTDLALGWGPMSDETVLEHISISQGSRFYFWSTDRFPVPRRDIEVNSANMHVIPATREVASRLDQVREGHIVELRGKLVNALATDGWTWKSSMTRTDTGPGACELFYVETVSYRAHR